MLWLGSVSASKLEASAIPVRRLFTTDGDRWRLTKRLSGLPVLSKTMVSLHGSSPSDEAKHRRWPLGGLRGHHWPSLLRDAIKACMAYLDSNASSGKAIFNR